MIIGHVTVPLIIYGLFPAHLNLIALLIGSGFPNFDAFPTLLRKTPLKKPMEETHASTVLHTLFLYILILPISFFLLDRFGIMNSWVIAMSFSLGGIIHVVSESFDVKGRRLLYPASKKFYGLKVLPYDFWTYLTDKKIVALEGGLLIAAFVVLLLF